MLINILYLYYFNNIKNSQVFNKLMSTSFILYLVLYYVFGNVVILIAVYDSIFFIEKKYNLNKSRKNILDFSNNVRQNILNKTKEIVENMTQPELEQSRFKPHIYNLKDTMFQLTQF